MTNFLTYVGITITVLFAYIAIAIVSIWSVNALFATEIGYSVETVLAAMVLTALISRSNNSQSKRS